MVYEPLFTLITSDTLLMTNPPTPQAVKKQAIVGAEILHTPQGFRVCGKYRQIGAIIEPDEGGDKHNQERAPRLGGEQGENHHRGLKQKHPRQHVPETEAVGQESREEYGLMHCLWRESPPR